MFYYKIYTVNNQQYLHFLSIFMALHKKTANNSKPLVFFFAFAKNQY